MASPEDSMEAQDDFKAITESIQHALVDTTRAVNHLANEDLQFQRTVNPAVTKRLDNCSSRILNLANGLLKSAAGSFQKAPVLKDADDIDVEWRDIVDVIDGLLEKVDTCLDDYTGLVKRKEAPASEPGRDAKRSKPTLDPSMKRANILKPQDAFEKKTSNFDSGPWKPLLTTKPHAKRSLEDSLQAYSEDEMNSYRHPYEAEILSLEYPEHIFEKRDPQMYLPIESTEATWVDTWEGVLEMLEELKLAKEIAIDLEHHDLRTYNGLLSLMQISTREKDWIVDTLVPWRHKLEVLNEVFADPTILKVMHGAHMDIIWLQRDLGLYIVGLFDTYHASFFLEYPAKSLAFLLEKFAHFTADKKYQLADWRIRPLPDEMMFYAQCDTHYLLYIYDMVRNELIERSDRDDPEKNLMGKVISKSQEYALQRYETAIYDAENGFNYRGWYNALSKSPTLYNGEQFAVYKAVHKWRDDVARRKDESPMFVMSQQVLADIARILPDDKMALWNLLTGNATSLRPEIDELLSLIQEARADGINGPSMLEFLRMHQEPGDEKPSQGNQPNAAAEADNIPNIKELKMEHSQLFGDMPVSSRYDGSKKPLASDLIVYHYPFPQPYNGEGNAASEQPQETTTITAPTDSGSAAKSAVDQEFTLRSGRKRKVDERDGSDSEIDADDAAGSGTTQPGGATRPIAPDGGEEASDSEQYDEEREKKRADKKRQKREAKEAKAAARAAKKARKAEKKAIRERAAQDASVEDVEEPFDYSKADSVLHASATNGSGPEKGKKAFNPYSDKSGDAPKGERKLGLVKTGRTATFKK